jgi:hypothetical protein
MPKTFKEIWDLLENDERCRLKECSDLHTYESTKNIPMRNWRRLYSGSIDEKIWLKIPEEVRYYD